MFPHGHGNRLEGASEVSSINDDLNDAISGMRHMMRHGHNQEQIEKQMAMIETLDKARKVQDTLPTGPEQPMTATEVMIRDVMRKVGVVMPKTYSGAIGAEAISYADAMIETAKWHVAMGKVTEYLAAQLKMDLFKDDPESKQIFERVILHGFHNLVNQAQGGYR